MLELDEAIPDGVRREVREETGLDVTVGPLTGVYKNMKLGVVALVFRAAPAGGEARPTDESSAVEWWTADEIAAGMDEAFGVRLLDALAGRAAPAVRAHDGVRLVDG